MLKQLAGFEISHMHVKRLTDKIGNELRDVRDEKTEQHRTRKLKQKSDVPVELACVAIDGGRVQTRLQGQGPGVHNGCWKETKRGSQDGITSRSPGGIDSANPGGVALRR